MRQVGCCDSGNGNTVGMLIGKNKSISFPSVRAQVTKKSLGKDFEIKSVTAEWRGTNYAVGDDVLIFNRTGADHHMGSGRYGGEMHQFLTAYALARLGVKSGQVDLTLLCPPTLYDEMKPVMVRNYQNNPVEIQLKGDKEPRQWAYESVTILPEGYAAVGAFLFDSEGVINPITAKVLDGDVVLLDIGAFTANVFRLHNRVFNQADLPQASIQYGGGNMHIRMPLLEWVHESGGDFKAVSLDDIDMALRKGSVTEEYCLEFGSKKIDLKPKLDELSFNYAGWIGNQLEGRYGGRLEAVNGILVVGGNALYVMPHLQQWYGKVIDYTKMPEFRRLHPADMNAVGGLRHAQARLAAKR